MTLFWIQDETNKPAIITENRINCLPGIIDNPISLGYKSKKNIY